MHGAAVGWHLPAMLMLHYLTTLQQGSITPTAVLSAAHLDRHWRRFLRHSSISNHSCCCQWGGGCYGSSNSSCGLQLAFLLRLVACRRRCAAANALDLNLALCTQHSQAAHHKLNHLGDPAMPAVIHSRHDAVTLSMACAAGCVSNVHLPCLPTHIDPYAERLATIFDK